MKILYIGVHTPEIWRSEIWIANAFKDCGHEVIKYDYKSKRKVFKTWKKIGMELSNLEKSTQPDIIFLQRGKKMSPKTFNLLKAPIFFWSTEPIKLKSDVDKLLHSNIFKWVFVHSYSCMEQVKIKFPHLIIKSSVIHNACPKSLINKDPIKTKFAIFNRNLSNRRKNWLKPSEGEVEIINGKFGEEYYNDLRNSAISVNIHFSDKNIDDFETGIFEAMANGCAIISEKLNSKTLEDLDLDDVIYQVEKPDALYNALREFKLNSKLLKKYQTKSQQSIENHTWHSRVNSFTKKFNEFI